MINYHRHRNRTLLCCSTSVLQTVLVLLAQSPFLAPHLLADRHAVVLEVLAVYDGGLAAGDQISEAFAFENLLLRQLDGAEAALVGHFADDAVHEPNAPALGQFIRVLDDPQPVLLLRLVLLVVGLGVVEKEHPLLGLARDMPTELRHPPHKVRMHIIVPVILLDLPEPIHIELHYRPGTCLMKEGMLECRQYCASTRVENTCSSTIWKPVPSAVHAMASWLLSSQASTQGTRSIVSSFRMKFGSQRWQGWLGFGYRRIACCNYLYAWLMCESVI